MKKITHFIVLFSVLTALFLPLHMTHAAGIVIDPKYFPIGSATTSGTVPKDNKVSDGAKYLEDARLQLTSKIISTVLAIAGSVAVFFIVYNGWSMATSAGKEEVITQHKKGLMWALVGLLLITLSYSIMRFVISIPLQADDRAPASTEAPPAKP